MRLKVISSRACLALAAAAALTGLNSQGAPVPPPEKLLPSDTVFMVTAPEYTNAMRMFSRMPTAGLWNDAAMKPFKDNFVKHFNEDLVAPLERELNLKIADYQDLAQGQVTLAALLDPNIADLEKAVSLVMVLDTREKSAQLKTNLANLQKRAVEANRPVRTEKVRGQDFLVLGASTNDMPNALRKFFPPALETQEMGDENKPAAAKAKSETVIGQVDSVLVAASSMPAAEKIVARLTGGSAPTLSEQAAFAANYQSMFRNAPIYGWINAASLVNLLQKSLSQRSENEDSPDPLSALDPAKLLSAMGLTGLRSMAFAMQESDQGQLVRFLIGAPENTRQGLFKILAGETKEAAPPPFVPADVVTFQRWRIDGQKAWATLERMINEISPQSVNGINFLVETANTAAREKDPSFDLRKNLIGNLGDDIISYNKAPKSMAAADLNSPPSVFLLGSPDPVKLSAALRTLLEFLGARGGAPTERDFNGRKITSIPLPALPLPMQSDVAGGKRTLNYAPTSGYLAFSTEVGMLEEYLRNTENAAKPLRSIPGLTEAAAKVSSPATSLFAYENQTETLRVMVEGLRRDPKSATNITALALLSGVPGFSTPEKSFKDWMDFSLLPSFDKISKYFHFSVAALNATTDGLEYRVFAPMPPQLNAK